MPLSGQVKKGLAAAFPKFDEYQLAKYDRGGPIKLRDVLFLCARQAARRGPGRSVEEADLGTSYHAGHVGGCTVSVGASETSLGDAKREAWERLLARAEAGSARAAPQPSQHAEAGVDEALVLGALREMSTGRVLPFRFLAAARYAPQWEETLEQAMLKSVAGQEKLPGKTIVLVTSPAR